MNVIHEFENKDNWIILIAKTAKERELLIELQKSLKNRKVKFGSLSVNGVLERITIKITDALMF